MQDHPYIADFLDTFALIRALIGETSRIGFMPNMANLSLRQRSGPGSQPIRTTPDALATIIVEFSREQRFETVNLVLENQTPGQLQRFATEVIPLALEMAPRGPAR